MKKGFVVPVVTAALMVMGLPPALQASPDDDFTSQANAGAQVISAPKIPSASLSSQPAPVGRVYRLVKVSDGRLPGGIGYVCQAADGRQGYNKIPREQLIATKRGECAELRGVDLSELDLSGANLRGADLRKAGLLRANLSGADLTGARLNGADIPANFQNAILKGADLRAADYGFMASGPQPVFAGAVYSQATRLPWIFGDREAQKRGMVCVQEHLAGNPDTPCAPR